MYIDIPLNIDEISNLEDLWNNGGDVKDLVTILKSWISKEDYKFKEGNIIGIRDNEFNISTVPAYLVYIYRDKGKLKYVFEGQTHYDPEHKFGGYILPVRLLSDMDPQHNIGGPSKQEKLKKQIEEIYQFPFIHGEKKKL